MEYIFIYILIFAFKESFLRLFIKRSCFGEFLRFQDRANNIINVFFNVKYFWSSKGVENGLISSFMREYGLFMLLKFVISYKNIRNNF